MVVKTLKRGEKRHLCAERSWELQQFTRKRLLEFAFMNFHTLRSELVHGHPLCNAGRRVELALNDFLELLQWEQPDLERVVDAELRAKAAVQSRIDARDDK